MEYIIIDGKEIEFNEYIEEDSIYDKFGDPGVKGYFQIEIITDMPEEDKDYCIEQIINDKVNS